MRMYDKAGRSRWPLVIGIAAVLVAAVIFFVVSARPSVTPVAGPPTVSATTTATPATPGPGGSSGAGDGEGDVAPTGCLGGWDRNAGTVLSAQKAAKHTAYGAVEAATAFYRFFWQSPVPSSADVETVTGQFLASDAPASFADLAGTYKSYPNVSSGSVPDGTPFHLSTTNGLWMVVGGSSEDTVTVNIAAGYVINGELSATKSTSLGFVMKWEESAWHLQQATQPDTDRLAAGGTRYTGGC